MPLTHSPATKNWRRENGKGGWGGDEVTGERRREEMKGSKEVKGAHEGGLGRRREKADGEDGGVTEGASG